LPCPRAPPLSLSPPPREGQATLLKHEAARISPPITGSLLNKSACVSLATNLEVNEGTHCPTASGAVAGPVPSVQLTLQGPPACFTRWLLSRVSVNEEFHLAPPSLLPVLQVCGFDPVTWGQRRPRRLRAQSHKTAPLHTQCRLSSLAVHQRSP
jgi:hypothetical protein